MQNPRPFPEKYLIRMKTGDRLAFHHFYHKYHLRLQSQAFRFTRCRELSKDIVQDVFLKLWENRNKLATIVVIEGYLFTMCRNRSVTLLAQALCEKRLLQNIAYMEQDFEAETCGQRAFEKSAQLLHAAIGQLPPRRRQIFRLCKLEGKSHKEAARELRISPGTIHDHIVKATRAIRKFLYLCGSFQET